MSFTYSNFKSEKVWRSEHARQIADSRKTRISPRLVVTERSSSLQTAAFCDIGVSKTHCERDANDTASPSLNRASAYMKAPILSDVPLPLRCHKFCKYVAGPMGIKLHLTDSQSLTCLVTCLQATTVHSVANMMTVTKLCISAFTCLSDSDSDEPGASEQSACSEPRNWF